MPTHPASRLQAALLELSYILVALTTPKSACSLTPSVLDSPQLTYRLARGTAAAPSAVQSGDSLGQITASGYKATGYTPNSRATITFMATENWNDTANGTAISFFT